MTPETSRVIAAVTQIVVATAAIIGSLVIPLVIYRGNRLRSQLEYVRSIYSQWIQIDLAMLQHPELRKEFDSLYSLEQIPLDERDSLIKWMGFLELNVLYTHFLAEKYGLSPETESATIRKQLSVLLKNDLIFRSVCDHYPDSYRHLCVQIRKDLGLSADSNHTPQNSKQTVP